MVSVGTGSSGDKEIARDWPVEEGLTAGTTRQERTQMNLVAEEGSIVPERLKEGIG